MDYEIVKCLKGGTTCRTYLVRLKETGAYRFLKELPAEGENWEYFSMEAMLLKKRLHKGIPLLYSLEESDGKLRILEEYVEGKSFDTLLLEAKTPEVLLFCILEVCRILQCLHQHGFVYTDLKPEHILCGKERIYLVDFGNCRRIGEPSAGKLTEYYAAPEQFHEAVAGVHMDIYSIGVLLMEVWNHLGKMILRKGRKAVGLREWLSGVIDRCMMPEIEKRYQDMEELIVALSQTKMFGYRLYIYGIREYVGSTHLALSLGSYLKERGRSVAYVSMGERDAYQALLDNQALQECRTCLEEWQYNTQGMYLYCGIQVQNHDWHYLREYSCEEVWIYDYGAFEGQQERWCALGEGDLVIVVISGTSPWNDRKQLLTMVENIKKQCGKRVIFVGNFVDKKDCRAMEQQLGTEILRMPFFSVEKMDASEVQRFMRLLQRRIERLL